MQFCVYDLFFFRVVSQTRSNVAVTNYHISFVDQFPLASIGTHSSNKQYPYIHRRLPINSFIDWFFLSFFSLFAPTAALAFYWKRCAVAWIIVCKIRRCVFVTFTAPANQNHWPDIDGWCVRLLGACLYDLVSFSPQLTRLQK